MKTAAAWLLACALAGPAAALDLQPVLLRDIGLTPGDTLQSQVDWPADAGALDPATLPVPGRIAAWLDLQRVDAADGRLRFTWQVLGSVAAAEVLALPRIELRTLDGQGVTLQPARFHLSPVLPAQLESQRPRPAPPPPPFDTRGPRWTALASAGVALLCTLALLWLADRLPGWPRHPGPLLQLWRELRRQRRDGSDGLDEQALRRVHQALGQAAGQTLYPHTLPALFAARPALLPLRPAIEAFFAASWSRLFGAGAPPVPPALLDWLEPAVLSERLSRRGGAAR